MTTFEKILSAAQNYQNFNDFYLLKKYILRKYLYTSVFWVEFILGQYRLNPLVVSGVLLYYFRKRSNQNIEYLIGQLERNAVHP